MKGFEVCEETGVHAPGCPYEEPEIFYILLCDDTWRRIDDPLKAIQAEKDAIEAGIEFVALIEGEVL